jgi:peptidoglycan/LPS O-acetylase OafA/YrhL
MAAMFFVGGALWCYRIDFTRTWRLAIVLLALVLVSATLGQRAFLVCYTLAIPVIVLSMAYMPARPLLAYNRVGDYSYGMYIYAFPVQQWTVALWAGIGTWTLTAVSIPVTLVFAALSWHLIEKRALAMKPQRRGPPSA